MLFSLLQMASAKIFFYKNVSSYYVTCLGFVCIIKIMIVSVNRNAAAPEHPFWLGPHGKSKKYEFTETWKLRKLRNLKPVIINF